MRIRHVDEALCLEVCNQHSGNPEWYPHYRRNFGDRAGGVTHAQYPLTFRLGIDPVGPPGRRCRHERLERDLLDGTCATSRSQVRPDPPAVRCLHRVTFPSRVPVNRRLEPPG